MAAAPAHGAHAQATKSIVESRTPNCHRQGGKVAGHPAAAAAVPCPVQQAIRLGHCCNTLQAHAYIEAGACHVRLHTTCCPDCIGSQKHSSSSHRTNFGGSGGGGQISGQAPCLRSSHSGAGSRHMSLPGPVRTQLPWQRLSHGLPAGSKQHQRSSRQACKA